MQVAKKVKKDIVEENIPKTIFIKFINNQNQSLDPIEIPLDSGPKDFQ